MTTVIHVATTGSDSDDGSADAPLRTINRAGALAHPGDTVRVHGGEYREWVKPQRGGLSDQRRITYEVVSGEHVIIKGSERVTGWVRDSGTAWRASMPNSLFGEFNPFMMEIDGDWIERPTSGERRHLGDVYLNGRSLYEAASRNAVVSPVTCTRTVDFWTELVETVTDPDQRLFVWFAEVGQESTTVWANFHQFDPNVELVEVSHGPYLVDHNIFASRVSAESTCQGGAYVNNLIAGAVCLETVQDRATPHHVPHSTEVAGYAVVDGGDDRFIGNVFLGAELDQAFAPESSRHGMSAYGTVGYDRRPASVAEYRARLDEGTGDHERFREMKQPVYIRSNAYANGAKSFRAEQSPVLVEARVEVDVVDSGDEVFLDLFVPDPLAAARIGVVTASDLEPVRHPDADFEDWDGSPVVLDTALTGSRKTLDALYPLGPLAELPAGRSRTARVVKPAWHLDVARPRGARPLGRVCRAVGSPTSVAGQKPRCSGDSHVVARTVPTWTHAYAARVGLPHG
jgi:Protein of unknown function (DUF1565)